MPLSRLITIPRERRARPTTAFGHCANKLVRVIWKMLTDEVGFNLEYEVCILYAIDFEKELLGSFVKVILTRNKKPNFCLIYT